MIKKTALFIFMVMNINAFGQRVFWADKVNDFTTELSPAEYSAQQVLGKPNAMPQGGDNPNAWMPAKPNRMEYIKVSFERPIRVQQIIISESYNPSAVFEIYLYNRNGNEFLVHTFEPKPLDITGGRVLNVFIERTNYRVYSLRLVVDGTKVPGYSAIDAIGVSASRQKIEVEITQPQNLKPAIVVEELDENINSDFEENRPLIAPDGKTLYFSRSNHPENIGGADDENDIWYSEQDASTGDWSEAKNLGRPLNNKGANYVSSITPDGNAMTVLLGNEYGKRDKMNPGVSVSTKSSEGWSNPQPLNITNAQILSTDGSYFLANNRKVLVMAIDRFDAFGGKDLYVSFLQRDGRWTEPLSLGNDINTAHMESAPYLAADNETLYFSSKGFSGYGESDVYISRRLDDTWVNWTEPENLGPDINSDGDDVFFTIPPSGKFAYYAKSAAEDPGNIHRIELPIFYQPAPVASLSGTVVDAETGQPVKARITYSLLPENLEIGFVFSDSLTGQYEILLPVGSAYDFIAEAEDYSLARDRINLSEETDFREMERNIGLSKWTETKEMQETVTVAEPVEDDDGLFSNVVHFEFASDYLVEGDYPFLPKMVAFLNDHADAKLKITGHTDAVGPAAYNQSLSTRRAKSVSKFIAAKGISAERIIVVGFGPDKPIASNDTDEGRRKNRRVEFELIR